MPSWNDGDESSDDDIIGGNLMDMGYFVTPDTIPEPLFCGAPMEEVPKCTLHEMMPRKQASYDDEVAKLKKEHDHVCTQYHKMVDGVSEMFDSRDGIGKVDYQKAMDAEKYEKRKEEVEMEMKTEKLRLAKE
ncbi:hypothetical protein D1007_45974 [Hordeum vulgare]|nr:hypothetical protein D1007_45974 [Hordeum vulgare]